MKNHYLLRAMLRKPRTCLLLCLVSLCSLAYGQSEPDTTTHPVRHWNNPFATLHVGGVLPELSRNQPFKPARFNDAVFWSYRAGVTIEAINTRWYGLRVELDYVRRGGAEEFAGLNGLLIESKTALHYVQGSLVPIIAKVGSPHFRGFVGAGGYSAYLVLSKLKYTFQGGYAPTTDDLLEKAVKKIDYGATLVTGFYWKKSIVELRYEEGMVPVYQYPDGRPVYNRAASLMLHF